MALSTSEIEFDYFRNKKILGKFDWGLQNV